MLAIVSLVVVLAPVRAQAHADRAISALMLAYQNDLNTSNAAASVALYTEDGVVTRANMARASMIGFNVVFQIPDIGHLALNRA